MSIERILFATDFTNAVTAAETYTINLAKSCGARVTIMHAVEPIAGEDPGEAIGGFIQKLVAESERRATEVSARFNSAGVEASTRVVIERSWKAIVDLASDEKFDLIVVGNHTATSSDKMTFGSTSHKVFFATRVPLLVVPAD